MAQAGSPKPQEKDIAVYKAGDGTEVRLSFDIVRRSLVSGHSEWVSEQEMIMYIGMCKAHRLNPTKRDCYLVKYSQGDPAAIIISIDYFRSRARAQPDCRGWTAGILIHDANGNLVEREGSLLLENETLLGGWFRAQPKGWEISRYWSVNLNTYIKKTKDGKPTQFWSEEKQPEQIAKVAESQGLRKVWPSEFQNTYIHEEEGQFHPTIEVEPIKRPVRTSQPEVAVLGQNRLPGKPEPEPEPLPEENPISKERLLLWLSMAPDAEVGAHENFMTQNVMKLPSAKDQMECLNKLNEKKRAIEKQGH